MIKIQDKSGGEFEKKDLMQSTITGKVALAFRRQVSLNYRIRSTQRLPFSFWLPRLRFRHTTPAPYHRSLTPLFPQIAKDKFDGWYRQAAYNIAKEIKILKLATVKVNRCARPAGSGLGTIKQGIYETDCPVDIVR